MIVNNLSISIHGNTILNNISFVLHSNDKVGLVGANGSGKSTLLKALSGTLEYDSKLIKLNNESVGYLKQEIPHQYDNLTILDYVKKEIGIDVLEKRLHDLESDLKEENMEEYGDILTEYLSLDGYNLENNFSFILKGLKLEKSFNDRISILSGGEKIKLLIATLLLKNTDILLLDEPTNNLDIDSILWLENHLKNLDKKMIIVSHDEIFLNHIANKIFELSNGTTKEYNLNYSDYLKEKESEYLKKFVEYNKAKEEKEKLKKQLGKAKEWANKGMKKKANNDNDKIANNYAKERTNTSKISKLSKQINDIKIPDFNEKKDINFFFSLDDTRGNKDISLEHLKCGYSTFKIPEINLLIPYGSRIQISGGNGTGKTTLIKTVLNLIPPLQGKITVGNSVRIGYLSQDTLYKDTDETILQFLLKNKEQVDMSFVFILLDKFNIKYDDRNKLYSYLSPGERTRVNLVKIALDKINVLILDEITNHLDKEALDLIYELVNNYAGTIISISHNRKYNEILDADIDVNVETGIVEMKK